MKIGLEVEFFGTKNSKIVNCSTLGLPHDEYPLLAEARGQAFNCVFQAVASVRGEVERITHLMKAKGIKPNFANWAKRDDKLEEEILREGYHKQIAYRNLLGLATSPKNKDFIAAGLHVSFTEERTVTFKYKKETQTSVYNSVFDFPILFNRIMTEFDKETTQAERVKGFYEVKLDGRVEYRSLPASIIHAPNFASRLAQCLK